MSSNAYTIDNTVDEWMVHKDIRKAGDVLDDMKKLCIRFSMRGSESDRDDLFQEAQLAVLIALEKFDSSKTRTFVNYASYWIRARIGRYLQKKSLVYHTETKERRLLMSRYSKCVSKYKSLSSDLTLNEIHEIIATELSCSAEAVDAFYCEKIATKSLNSHVKNDESFQELQDVIEGEHDTESLLLYNEKKRVFRQLVSSYTGSLNDRGAYIFRSRVSCDHNPETLQSIANRYGITKEAVRLIEIRITKDFFAFCKERVKSDR